MKLSMDKEKLIKLIEMAFIGQIVISEIVEDQEQVEKYFTTIQEFYESISSSGLEDIIHYDSEKGIYIETAEFEKRVLKDMIESYDEKVLMSTLPHLLASRDAMKEFATKTNYNLTDLYDRIEDYEDAYVAEFEENGLERLGIIGDLEDDEEDTLEFEEEIFML